MKIQLPPLLPPDTDGGTPMVLPQHMGHMRLDAALALLLPHLGLRGRRRLWEHHLVLVNGRPCGKGHLVTGGDSIALLACTPVPFDGASQEVYLVHAQGDLLAVHKPTGLHTTHLAGSPTPSLETRLPLLLQGWQEQGKIEGIWDEAVLLTRLDAATSGLVLLAKNTQVAEYFRQTEAAGQVRKEYLAIVQGTLPGPLLLNQALGTSQCKKTGVLPEINPDATRHTQVVPVQEIIGDSPCTLVRACILRGARHQIRAHLAAAGYPLAGDTLYGGQVYQGVAKFYLHHTKICLPGFSACVAPEQTGAWSYLSPFAEGENECVFPRS